MIDKELTEVTLTSVCTKAELAHTFQVAIDLELLADSDNIRKTH